MKEDISLFTKRFVFTVEMACVLIALITLIEVISGGKLLSANPGWQVLLATFIIMQFVLVMVSEFLNMNYVLYKICITILHFAFWVSVLLYVTGTFDIVSLCLDVSRYWLQQLYSILRR